MGLKLHFPDSKAYSNGKDIQVIFDIIDEMFNVSNKEAYQVLENFTANGDPLNLDDSVPVNIGAYNGTAILDNLQVQTSEGLQDLIGQEEPNSIFSNRYTDLRNANQYKLIVNTLNDSINELPTLEQDFGRVFLIASIESPSKPCKIPSARLKEFENLILKSKRITSLALLNMEVF